jgi:hypothetical protein
MRAQTFRSHRLAVAGVIAVALAVGALSQRAGAFNPQPDPPGYGMIGIADGQTARLNVVNLGVPDPTTGVPPDPCRMRLQFVDADGNVLVSRGIAPEMGHSAFLDFAPSFVPVNTTDAVAAAPLRAEIRAVLFSDNLQGARRAQPRSFFQFSRQRRTIGSSPPLVAPVSCSMR